MPGRRAAVASALMRDHYRQFSHPVVVDLPVQSTIDLFSEMDQIADELRVHPEHVDADDQIAFRQRQRVRFPQLSREEFLYCSRCGVITIKLDLSLRRASGARASRSFANSASPFSPNAPRRRRSTTRR